MKKRRLVIRNKKLKEEINYRKREGVRKDFYELLKRASKTTTSR